jgi:hypothetical protein
MRFPTALLFFLGAVVPSASSQVLLDSFGPYSLQVVPADIQQISLLEVSDTSGMRLLGWSDQSQSVYDLTISKQGKLSRITSLTAPYPIGAHPMETVWEGSPDRGSSGNA